jgi:xanthine dehydrogenase accessory factor
VGRALVHILKTLPQFDLTWVDFDQGRFPSETAPSTTVIQAAEMPMLVPHAPTDAHHFILTHSHDVDLALCLALLKHDFEYAGLIGSDTKWSRFRKRLTDAGLEMSDIERITCPIGRPEYGKHPSEIAIGILCNLLGDEGANTYGGRVAK